jgi:hypothetical protein
MSGIVRKWLDNKEKDNAITKLKLDNELLNASLQAATNILTAQTDDETTTGYTGSPYSNFRSQVNALSTKYSNTAKWGCLIAKNIIDVRAAFLIGSGIQVIKRESYIGDATRELEFLRRFIEFNKLDSSYPNELAKEGEIEGRALLRLVPDPEELKGMIRVVHVPWRMFSYEVLPDAPNFYRYLRAKYIGTGSDYKGSATLFPNSTYDASFDLGEGEFVYVRLGGNIYQPNITPSKTAYVLRQVEDLDKEMWDWRKINHLFAAPTPVFEFDSESVDEARRTEQYITEKNWRIGKAIVLAGGKYRLETHEGEGFTTIEKAVQTNVQIISGSTGVPVHFMGFPNLLSNRATAENLLELIQLSTDKERDAWRGGYTELAKKAVVMYNKEFNQNLKPEACEIVIPFASSATLNYIAKVYLPMYVAGAMSLDQLLSYITNVDVDKEITRIKEAEKEKEAKQEKEFQRQKEMALATQSRTTGNGSGRTVGNGQ